MPTVMNLGDRAHRLLMALGTTMLKVSIVLLGNFGFGGQTMIGASYIVLNGAYWLVSMVSKEHYWDLSRYEWREMSLRGMRGMPAARPTRTTYVMVSGALPGHCGMSSARRKARGGRRGAAPRPGTRNWRQWLREAEDNARAGNRRWAAVRRRDHIFADDESDAMR